MGGAWTLDQVWQASRSDDAFGQPGALESYIEIGKAEGATAPRFAASRTDAAWTARRSSELP